MLRSSQKNRTDGGKTSVERRKTSVCRDCFFQHLSWGLLFYIYDAQTDHMGRITLPPSPCTRPLSAMTRQDNRAQSIEYVLPTAGQLKFSLHHWTLFLSTPQNDANAAAQLDYLLSMGGNAPHLSPASPPSPAPKPYPSHGDEHPLRRLAPIKMVESSLQR